MLPGLHVVHRGQVCQVTRMTTFAPGMNYAGLPNTPTDYAMHNLVTGEHFTLRGPSSAQLGDMTPACDDCKVPAGYCSGIAGRHYRDLMPAQPQTVTHTQPRTGEGCDCRMLDCGHCGPGVVLMSGGGVH